MQVRQSDSAKISWNPDSAIENQISFIVALNISSVGKSVVMSDVVLSH